MRAALNRCDDKDLMRIAYEMRSGMVLRLFTDVGLARLLHTWRSEWP